MTQFTVLTDFGIPIILGLSKDPFVAGIRHIRQQHFHHHLLAFHRALTVGLHVHASGHIAAAAGGEHPLTLDLDHAGAAVAISTQAVFVAKVRNIYAVALGGFKNGFAIKRMNGFAI